MRTFFYLSLVVLMMSGCVSKKILVKGDLVQEQGLVHSKTTQIKKENKVVAYIVATYLNGIDKKYKDKNNEKFIVGIYASQKSGFEENVEITLNDDANTTVVHKLEQNNPLLHVVSSKNEWNKYFLAEGPSPDAKTISITFSAQGYESKKLIFNRDYL